MYIFIILQIQTKEYVLRIWSENKNMSLIIMTGSYSEILKLGGHFVQFSICLSDHPSNLLVAPTDCELVNNGRIMTVNLGISL